MRINIVIFWLKKNFGIANFMKRYIREKKNDFSMFVNSFLIFRYRVLYHLCTIFPFKLTFYGTEEVSPFRCIIASTSGSQNVEWKYDAILHSIFIFSKERNDSDINFFTDGTENKFLHVTYAPKSEKSSIERGINVGTATFLDYCCRIFLWGNR